MEGDAFWVPMPNLTKRTMPDRSKIDIEDAKQVKYWTKALEVSKDDLLEAIDKVGNAAATVRKELQKGTGDARGRQAT